MLLRQIFEDVSQSQLNDVEKFADRLWGKLGIDIKFTKHFVDRVNDERNGKEISASELIRIFKKEYEQYGKEIKNLSTDDEAVLVDLITDINLPFVFKNTKQGKELVAKTIMRKSDFKSIDPTYKIK